MIPRHLLIAVAALLALVVSMGIYMGRMRRQAGELESSAANCAARATTGLGSDGNGNIVRRR